MRLSSFRFRALLLVLLALLYTGRNLLYETASISQELQWKDVQPLVSSSDLWIYVSSWSEGIAGWTIALSEILILAKKFNATVVEPCIRGGRLYPCGNTTTQLKFSTMFDTSEFKDHFKSHEEFKKQISGEKQVFKMCMMMYKAKDFEKETKVCRNRVTNYYKKRRSEPLENAVMAGSAGTTMLDISEFRQDSFSEMTFQGNKLIDSNLRTRTKQSMLRFKHEHKQAVEEMLTQMGISANDSIAAIQWRAEIDGIDYVECAKSVLRARDNMTASPRGSNSTKFFLISSLSTHEDLQWSGAKQKSKKSNAGQALQMLLNAGFYKLDTVISDGNVTDMIQLVIWDLVVVTMATDYATCSECRTHECAKCNYVIGKFPKLTMELRQAIGKDSNQCWPTEPTLSTVSLRFDWSNLRLISQLAKEIDAVQSKCLQPQLSNPVHAKEQTLIKSGLGSSLHTWTESLCHAVENDMVLFTRGDWQWTDKKRCPSDSESPLACYFGDQKGGSHCPNGTYAIKKGDWKGYRNLGTCQKLKNKYTVPGVRAAAIEWLFSSISPLVLLESRKQIQESFGNSGLPPSDSLITINIRWGDKGKEMQLIPIAQYINATKGLLRKDELDGKSPVNIYLSSEDPHAIREFQDAAPSHWKVYASGPTNALDVIDMMTAAVSTEGAAGLESIAALLIAVEANRYVLTTRSNWSRLINELRKNVVDPRCGDCTQIVDLHHGEW